MKNNVVRLPIKNDKLFSIQEGVVVGHAEKVKRYTDGKVRFSAILQTCNDTNRNKRMYPLDVMQQACQRVMPIVKNRNLLGELDHPICDNQIRQTTVLYEHASHIVADLQFRGDQVWGEIESTPYTPKGKILSGLVLDNVAIGFSLRGLADLEDNGTCQVVLPPLIIITWDCVQQPSHQQASIQEVHQESLKVINESANIIECSNGICYIANTFDKLIEQKILKLHEQYWKK
jgi:hypothetical protein